MLRFDSASRRISVGHAQVAWSAWTTLGVVTLFHTIGMPLQTYGGLLMYMLTEPITEGGRFGWSNGSVGAALGCFFLIAGLAAPILGAVGDRWGGRPVLMGMALLYGVGMTGLGLMRDEWHFFLAYGGLLSLVFIASMVPMMGLLNPWFQHRLGLAIGVVQSLGSLGGAAFTPIMALLLQRWGWLPTFLAMGLVGSGLMLAALRFYRWRPDAPRRGLSAAAEDTPDVAPRAEARARLVRQQMRATQAYWKLPIIHGLGCGGHGIVLAFVVSLMAHNGFGNVTSALVLTLITFGSIPSRLLSPMLAERMEGRTLMSAVLLLQGLGIVGFLISHDLWTLYAVATLFGVAYGGEATVYPVINRRYFGKRPLSGIHGRQVLGALVGQSLSVAAAGLIIDHFGEVPGFTLGIALNFAGAALVWTMESTRNVLVTVEDVPGPGEVASGRCC